MSNLWLFACKVTTVIILCQTMKLISSEQWNLSTWHLWWHTLCKLLQIAWKDTDAPVDVKDVSKVTFIYKLVSNSYLLNFSVNALWKVQSTVKLFKHQQWYLQIFYVFIANFHNLMLVINSIKLKDHDLTNIYFIKLH